MSNKINLKVNTNINAINDILSWLEQINQPPLINPETWWELQTLLVEGFINIVEHAHKNFPEEIPIELEVIRLKKDIEIRIWSCGQAFNLVNQLQVTLELEDNYQDRGRGLKIISTIADNLSYEPTEDNRYCLFMSKHY